MCVKGRSVVFPLFLLQVFVLKQKRGKKNPLKRFSVIKYYFSYIPETGLPTGYPITSVELQKGCSNLEYTSDYCFELDF